MYDPFQIKFLTSNHISGLASSGMTVNFTTSLFALLTTTFSGFPIRSSIISTICHRFATRKHRGERKFDLQGKQRSLQH